MVIAVALIVLSIGASGVATAADVDHEHPDEVESGDDLAGVERWLAGQIQKRHVDCAEGYSIGNFDACEDLDSEYKSLLESYVTVERETEGNTTDSKQLNETWQRQQEYARLRAEFNETFDEYQTARENGDEAEARAKARELRDITDRLEELSDELNTRFRRLESDVNANFSAASRSINDSTEEVQSITDGVESETFEPTRVEASADERAAFDQPATISGQVTQINDSVVNAGRIVVSDGNQTFSSPVSIDGRFEIEYRPSVVSTGETRLAVRYRPPDDWPYLRSNTTVTTSVDSTASDVTVSAVNDSIAFGDVIRVEGSVTAADRGPEDVPVVISTDNRTLARTTTDSSGRFNATGVLPPDLAVGTQTLTIRASESQTALAQSVETRDLKIDGTRTDLRVTATPGEDVLAISGRLVPVSEGPIGERPITVTVKGTTYEVTTDPDGYFRLDHPLEKDEDVGVVTATYDEESSNLESSSARDRVGSTSPLAAVTTQLEMKLNDLMSFMRSHPVLSAVAGIAIVINCVVWGIMLWSRFMSPETQPDTSTMGQEEQSTSGTPGNTAPGPSEATLMEAARNFVETNPESAVRTGYAAVRTGLDGDRGSETHWEFYHSIQSELPNEMEPSLRSLTETFERATFTSEGIDQRTAKGAIEDAERCLQSDG